MKCSKCNGTKTRCGEAGQCDHDGSECFEYDNCGEYEHISCPDCNGTGSTPDNLKEISSIDLDPEATKVLNDNFWKLTGETPNNQEEEIKQAYAEYSQKYPKRTIVFVDYKAGRDSRDEELNIYDENNVRLCKQLLSAKQQIEDMKCHGNCYYVDNGRHQAPCYECDNLNNWKPRSK